MVILLMNITPKEKNMYMFCFFYLGKKMIIGTIHANKSYKSINSSGPKQKIIKVKSLEMSINICFRTV
jgi:hypothetical protein